MQNIENPALYAEALSRMGRGPDTQLMHVTDSEVDALSGLSSIVFNEPLRTNPETGLPEAGLFKRLLPAIAAAAAIYFTGGAAAGMIGGTTAAAAGTGATMAGTALAGFGGHALGQLASTGDVNFLDAARSGGLAALTAGVGKGFGGGAETTVAGDFELAGAAAPSFNPATMVDALQPGSDQALSAMSNASHGGGYAGYEIIDDFPSSSDLFQQQLGQFAPQPAMTTGEQFIADVRLPEEVYKHIAEDPLKRIGGPLLMAGLSGELDEPLPEAPAGPSRTPFTPKDFKFTRQRRDIDIDGDGEISEEEISEVVQGLPEGQSSRFFTPGVFTEDELNAKEGGLLRLRTGGNIQEAIGSLTGGAGASLLPILAQSVIRPEDEEEESVTKGYPLGVAGTAPGAASTGMAIGGGQPPQPFQEGGLTALEEAFKDLGGGNAGIGEGPGPSGAPAGGNSTGGPNSAAEAQGFGSFGFGEGKGTNSGPTRGQTTGFIGSTAAKGLLGLGALTPPGLVISALGYLAGKAIDNNAIPQHANELNSYMAQDQEATSQAATAAAAAQAAAAQAAQLGIAEDIDIPGSLEGFAGLGGGEAGASGVGSGAGAPGGPQGEGDTIGGEEGSDGSDGDGSGGGGAGAAGGADGEGDGPGGWEQGGYLGGISSRAHGGLLQLAEGGSVPYFEGMVRGPGDGMSDNIPFVIAGRQEGGQMGMQPAVLSPDEYVFPADVVSSLGNGSSNAGANQLDQFINNFRMDKYGRPSQPPEMSGGLSSLG